MTRLMYVRRPQHVSRCSLYMNTHKSHIICICYLYNLQLSSVTRLAGCG